MLMGEVGSLRGTQGSPFFTVGKEPLGVDCLLSGCKSSLSNCLGCKTEGIFSGNSALALAIKQSDIAAVDIVKKGACV